MAKIIITIKDEMPVNGRAGVSVSYEGDFLEPLQSGVTYTQAQMAAGTIKALLDCIECNPDMGKVTVN